MSIELSDVSFAYPNGSVAVDHVTLHVDDGERVALVGQNGAGKTTVAKMMNGLVRPSSGIVTVNDVPTAGRTTADVARTVGYVFQNPDNQLFAGSVQDELEFMPKYYKWDSRRRVERVVRAARMAGLGHCMNVNPSDLPLAIRKFVAIGAILVGECRYVIMDEPTAGLDQHGLLLLQRMLDQLQTERVGVVVITHDMHFVASSFARVVVMASHHVIADGDVRTVFADDDTLRASRIRRPTVSQLSFDLELGRMALSCKELAELIP